jgi:hypothetical protein
MNILHIHILIVGFPFYPGIYLDNLYGLYITPSLVCDAGISFINHAPASAFLSPELIFS